MTRRSTTVTNLRPTGRVRTALRRVGRVLAAVLLASTASVVANAVLTSRERAEPHAYGQRVALPAGSLNVSRTGGDGPVLVLLSGLATPAPAVDFAPLIRELGGFDVIVVEGFGYGYSDLDVPDRSVENIAGELHQTLHGLGVVQPVTLIGHSIGGTYARYYAQAYPDEVAAIVGIDPTPASISTREVGEPSPVGRLIAGSGLLRWLATLAPDLVLPDSTAYSESERATMLSLAIRNFGNRSLADEEAHLAANLTAAAAQPFPAQIPVLELLAGDAVASSSDKVARHERELAGVRRHELQVVPGAHYLHWTQAPLLGRSIAAFLARELPAARIAR